MGAKLATPSTNLLALPDGTELVGDYRIRRVLGAGGFGITYLADETALGRVVTIKEYFPAEFAARRDRSAMPRSRNVTEEYKWGLERFLEEAQTLARFDHPNVVRVHRYFRANNTGYMVLKFEEGGSFKAWLKGLKRPPLQSELDRMLEPLLDALELIHKADFLHRDIAPDNIMVRKDGSPVLIDFGSARGALANQSRTVSALVKPGYSPYEQYATSGANQGPWTDIYALGATLYHAITGKRPPDAPSRVVNDEYVPAAQAAPGSYRVTFLEAIDQALRVDISKRPQRVADWRGPLLDPEPRRKPSRAGAKEPPSGTLLGRLRAAEEEETGVDAGPKAGSKSGAKPASKSGPKSPPKSGRSPGPVPDKVPDTAAAKAPDHAADVAVAKQEAPSGASAPASRSVSLVPSPPDTPQRKGHFLDFIDALKQRPAKQPQPAAEPAATPADSDAKTEIAAFASIDRSEPTTALTATAPVTTGGVLALPPPPVLQRERTGRQGSLARSALFWARWSFRVAMALTVSALAISYEKQVRLSSAVSSDAASRTAEGAAPSLQLKAHKGAVIAVASALDDQSIVSAGADATVRVWSAGAGTLKRTIELAEGPVSALAVDNRRALVGHQDGAVVLWDLTSGARLATLRHGTAAIAAVAFLGDRMVAVGRDGDIVLLDSGGPATTLIEAQDGGGSLLAASRARTLLVTAGLDRSIRLWRGQEPQLVRTLHLTGDSTAIAIAADGTAIAGGSAGGVVRYQRSPALRGPAVYPVQTFKAHAGGVAALALGPPGLLASAGEDGSLKLWTLQPERSVRALDGGQVQSLCFSRDGRRLMAGGKDGVVRVWKMAVPTMSGPT